MVLTLRFHFLFCFLCLTCWLCSPAFAQEVVVLHSTPAPSDRTTELDRGAAETLKHGITVLPVHLGFGDEDDDFYHERYEELAVSWNTRRPLAVVADGKLAFAFVRKYREDLFGHAPVIYCNMRRPEPYELDQCGECTGIPIEFDMKQAVELVFALRPETTVVVGISGDSPEAGRLRKATQQGMAAYEGRARLLFPGHEPGDDNGLTRGYALDVAAGMPRSGALLLLEYREDSEGKRIDMTSLATELVRRSDAPVYVLQDTLLDSGTVGGVVIDNRAVGAAVGRAAQRIADGEPVREMLPAPVRAHPVVDLTALARFGISAQRIPHGTAKRNPPDRPNATEGADATGTVAVAVAILALLAVYALPRRPATRKGR